MFRKSRSGQSTVEYMLLISVVVIAIVAAAYVFLDPFQSGVEELGGAEGSRCPPRTLLQHLSHTSTLNPTTFQPTQNLEDLQARMTYRPRRELADPPGLRAAEIALHIHRVGVG